MKLRKRTFIFLPILCLAAYLGYSVFDSIYTAHVVDTTIKRADKEVVEKLKQIREAEKAYFQVNRRFTDDWDSLANFLIDGEFVITSKSEKIITRPYGGDSVVTTIDTLGQVSVYDSLTVNIGLNKKSVYDLETVPVSNDKFRVNVDNSGTIAYLLVEDPAPVNPRRQEDGNLPPLRIGSLTKSTLRGSWE